ncbi:MAG: alkaline phosphatase family protein [Verrucomicrobia bacterium]|nr:alkaline phosphatase family protein [Verrucomicrobiota bacterium]
MKHIAILISLLVTCTSFCPALEPVSDRIVVLISVDGLASYYMDDPKAEMPTIRQLAAEGAVAAKMKAVLPTVTWPNHTSLATGTGPGKHGVIGNTWLDRSKNEIVTAIWDSVFDKDEVVKVPTIYDVAKQAGLKTAAVTWPCSRSARTLDWTVPCVMSNALFVSHSTPSLLKEFQQAGIPYENEADGFKPGRGEDRDRLHVRMFNHIVRTHRPQLILMHILEVDHVEHVHAPQSPEAYASIKFADGLVREMWDEVKKDFPGKATMIVVSDHGFFPTCQSILPNVVLRKAGLLTVEGKKITGGQVRAVAQGGASLIYVLDPQNREKLIEQVVAAFKGKEGVSGVLTKRDFPKYGLSDPARQPHMCDIILTAKSGYSFGDTATGEVEVSLPGKVIRGSHGYDPNEPRMHAMFAAWGVGIRRGAKAGTITNTSVAPTIAALLGLEMKNTDGQPLKAILTK